MSIVTVFTAMHLVACTDLERGVKTRRSGPAGRRAGEGGEPGGVAGAGEG